MKRYFAQLSTAVGILFSFTSHAVSYIPTLTSQDQPWSITASVGSANYQVVANDKNSALGRLALGNELLLAGDIALGLELGLQTGNKICLTIPKKSLSRLRWTPVHTTLSPVLDLLITTKTDPLFNSAFFAQLKGGIAYRHWKINRIPVNEISQLAGEVQAGFGYPITALASLSLLYQGIYGNTPNAQLDPYSNRTNLANIPTLHAVLVGLSVNL
ncbi:MAG: hypothetical protein P4L79_12530 [Legionella sp.]|uniref:hypothetical protein n=1 Tax=Legionella sp. TaxID=459 RepID=UPI002845AE30|nr:hypothetical protein [Legionella sp.]